MGETNDVELTPMACTPEATNTNTDTDADAMQPQAQVPVLERPEMGTQMMSGQAWPQACVSPTPATGSRAHMRPCGKAAGRGYAAVTRGCSGLGLLRRFPHRRRL